MRPSIEARPSRTRLATRRSSCQKAGPRPAFRGRLPARVPGSTKLARLSMSEVPTRAPAARSGRSLVFAFRLLSRPVVMLNGNADRQRRVAADHRPMTLVEVAVAVRIIDVEIVLLRKRVLGLSGRLVAGDGVRRLHDAAIE